MSSRRVQQLAVTNSNASNSQHAEAKFLGATVRCSHYVGSTGIRQNVHLPVSVTCSPPLKSLMRYVSDESQDQNIALSSFPSRQSKPLVRYVSDESQHYDGALPEKEQSDLVHIPNTKNYKEHIPQVVSILEENQPSNTNSTLGCIISSERIDMFVNEAYIQSQNEKLIQPQHFTPPENQELISFLTLFEQQMEASSNNPNEPVPLKDVTRFDGIAPLNSYSCVATKAPMETCPEKRTFIIADGIVPDSTTSNTSTSSISKPSKVSLPVRPLTAYNYFFADEREKILSGNNNDVYDDHKKQRLLLQHIMKDRSARRKHRKTHGKINFTTLTRMISQRWKTLAQDKKEFYKDISAADWARYRRELSERRIEQNDTCVDSDELIVAPRSP